MTPVPLQEADFEIHRAEPVYEEPVYEEPGGAGRARAVHAEEQVPYADPQPSYTEEHALYRRAIHAEAQPSADTELHRDLTVHHKR